MSCLTRDRLRQGSRIQRRSPPELITASGRLEHAEDRRRVLSPGRGLGAQLLAAAGGEAVELGLAVVLARAPLRLDGAGALEAMQCLVEGRVLDLEDPARAFLDPA